MEARLDFHGHSLAASLCSIAADDPATGSTARASRDAQGELTTPRDVTRESSYVESSRGAFTRMGTAASAASLSITG
jgi:hypothetical protein